jgi:hypothetical protein
LTLSDFLTKIFSQKKLGSMSTYSTPSSKRNKRKKKMKNAYKRINVNDNNNDDNNNNIFYDFKKVS